MYVEDGKPDVECPDTGTELSEERKGWRLTLGQGKAVVGHAIV